MQHLFRIYYYLKSYLVYITLNIICNLFSVIFSLLSLTMIIPFLGILFETQEKVYNPATITFNAQVIKENFYAILTSLIDDKGKIQALLFICIVVLASFFLRNLFRYLALFFMTPIRNGIVHDLRVELHNKVLSLNLSFFSKRKSGDITSRLTSDLIEVEWSIMSSIETVS